MYTTPITRSRMSAVLHHTTQAMYCTSCVLHYTRYTGCVSHYTAALRYTSYTTLHQLHYATLAALYATPAVHYTRCTTLHQLHQLHTATIHCSVHCSKHTWHGDAPLFSCHLIAASHNYFTQLPRCHKTQLLKNFLGAQMSTCITKHTMQLKQKTTKWYKKYTLAKIKYKNIIYFWKHISITMK